MKNFSLSLLNNTIFNAVLNVLGILLLIAAAVFIIVFLADLLISIIEGRKGIFFSRKSKENEKVNVMEEQKTLTYTKNEEKVETQQVEVKPAEEIQEVDFDQAEFEKQLMDEADIELEERKQVIGKDKEEIESFDENDKEIDDLYAKLIEEINEEVAQNEEGNTEETEAQEDEISFDEIASLVEENEEVVEETEVETLEEVEELEEDLAETSNEDDEKIKALEEELNALKEQLKKEQEEKAEVEAHKAQLVEEHAKAVEEKDALIKELETKSNEIVVEDGETLESLLKRKSNLEERLKVVEKDFKKNKKEYMPLSRIKKTLENDEAKLRRKEAIVAKKQMVLFGVNNYVADPEKEQQHANDLDALDALRLSVENCQKIMKENEDRYPILENTYNILTRTMEDIKSDIAHLDEKIKALQDKEGNGENE